MVKKQLAEIDPVLAPLLRLTSDEEVDDLLSQLITQHADPVIKGIIRYKFHLNFHQVTGQADANDMHQEVMVQLLTALQQLRAKPDDHPIGDLRALAAVITHRTCSRWMRRQFPERHAFKNRLYYLLTHQRGFAVWKNEKKKLFAGFAAWQGKRDLVTDERLNRLSDDETLFTQIRLLKTGKQGDWGDTLAAIFNYLGSPIEFDRLIRALAGILQIVDRPVESVDLNEDLAGIETSSGEPDAAWRVEKRIFLQRLWEEVVQLPLNQRAALLFNLRDNEGRGCIALFPALGVATLRQLAEAMEMSAEKLAGLWSDLPLEDAKVAELLGLSRQQVINARKAGRERLTRRLKGFI